MLYSERARILDQAEVNVGNLAWLLESRLGSTFKRVESDLRRTERLLEAPRPKGETAAQERARVEALLADRAAEFPEVVRIEVFDAAGTLLFSSNPGQDRAADISDTDSFRRFKENLAPGFLYTGVLAALGEGRPTIVAARAMLGPDGHFLGTINALLDLGHFQALIESIDVGAQGLVTVRRRDDNRLVLRWPPAPTEVNRVLDSPTWRRVESGEVSGWMQAVSPLDKITRIQHFRALKGHPFWVMAAQSSDEILAGWRKGAWISGSMTAASLALFSLLVAGMHRAERRRSRAVHALTRNENDLRVAATAFNSQEAMLITDAHFSVLKVNQSYTRITGFSAEESFGQNAWKWRAVHENEALEAAQHKALSACGFWSGEIHSRRKSGETFVAWLTISAVAAGDGRVTHYVASFTDLSERKAAEESIRTLAFYDPLTRLPNRRLLVDRLERAMTVSERSRAHCALIFLDLDNFKFVNDTRGHAVGDALLIAAAERLRHCVRTSDTVTRQGGDEFVVLLEDLGTDATTAAAHAGDVAEKIRLALAEPFALDGAQYHGSASLGVCLFSGREYDANELFKRCDTAMYQAKQAGRNALRLFDPAMQAALERRASLDADLRQAIVLGQFELHYQVQVDHNSRAIGAEALLRWNHPVRGRVSPLDFIPLAEETGVIVSIGQWVLDTACDRLAQWADDPLTRGMQLAINVSARQFRQRNFVASVCASLQRSGARATQLELELTESIVMDDVADTIAKMEALRALGVTFAVDDFGTGYSSLAYLQRLPLDRLKIDRSFVLDLGRDSQRAAIVRSIITLGEVLGLNVIAEGVETEVQREVLVGLGCGGFQGYLFAHPLPLERLLERLRELRPDQVQAAQVPAEGHTSGTAALARSPQAQSPRPRARRERSALAD